MSKDKFDAEEIVEALAKIGEPEPSFFAGTALYDVSHWQTSGRVVAKQFSASSINMRGTTIYGEQDGDTIT